MLFATLGSCVKGDKGDTGSSGTNGTNGLNGNANVSTGTISINASSWIWDAASASYYCNITDTAVNSSIVASGSVLVFFQSSGLNWWQAIPSSMALSSTASLYLNYYYELNTVQLSLQFSSLSTASSIATYNVKIVCIKSGLRKSHPNTNWNDYNEVMAVISESGTGTTN